MTSALSTEILIRARLALRPPPRLHLSDWAEAHFYLSAESSAEAGRWTTIPYQRGIMNAFTDPAVVRCSVMKSARVGWTKILNAVAGYYIHQDPCPIMIVMPTIEDAQGHSKEEIAPMLRDCPVLAAIIPEPKTRDSDNTILAKRYPGGSLTIIGANSPRGFRRVSRKVVLFDETDGYPISAGSEGDQIQLGIRRTEYYWDRKIGDGSTPTDAGRSRIEKAFHAGDQRRYYVPCPHCREKQVLVFTNFKWPKGKPELAVCICIHCGAEIEHQHKRAMVAAGEWRPGPHTQFPDAPPPAPFTGHASFHIWAAYSYSPNATWGQLAKEFDEARLKGAEDLKTFINTALGETWHDRGDAPDWERLYQRRDLYPIASCPMGVLFLTVGVDVQKDRLVYEVVGWGRAKRSWSIDAGILPGDTSDAGVKGPWIKLDELLSRQYPHAGGVNLPIAMLAIDSGYNTQIVYAWARRHAMSRVIAVKGAPAARTLVGLPSPVDILFNGRRSKRGYKVWPIGVNIAKAELYGWLSLSAPTKEAAAAGEVDPPGYCRFPEHGEEYFKQLTAEQQVAHRTNKGYTVMVWEQIPGRENHFLDTRIYARGAAGVVGVDRFTDTDWESLERSLGIVSPQQTLPLNDEGSADEPRDERGRDRASSPPTPPRRDSVPRPPGGWLGPKRSNWLKGPR